MITISIYGLDQYTVGHYSKDHTKNIANLFETSEDDILFYSPNAYVFHSGVEQTSWNAIVKVNAPEKFEPLEGKIAKYLLDTLKEFSINLTLEFNYFHGHHQYEHINKEYPRFITEENVATVDEYDEDEEEIYTGNIFADKQKELDEAYNEDHCHCHKDGCECDCDDDCDCDCEDGECHCGHNH